jgi:hypothetical protein
MLKDNTASSSEAVSHIRRHALCEFADIITQSLSHVVLQRFAIEEV